MLSENIQSRKRKQIFLLLLCLFPLISANANEFEPGGTGEVTVVLTSISSTVSSVTIGSAAGANAIYIESHGTASFTQSGSTVTIKFDVTLTSDAPVGNMNVYFTMLIITSGSMSNLPYSVTIEVTESSGLNANFTSTPTNGAPPLQVQFTNLSTGTIDTFNWDFGDGHSSSEENPIHIYNDLGSYTVKLIVSGDEGADTLEKKDFIKVMQQVDVSFGPQKILDSDLSYIFHVCAADLNSDGKEDVFASPGGDYAIWFKNLGRGNFTDLEWISPTAWALGYSIPVDINGDDHIDILTTGGAGKDRITWYKNSGHGSFLDLKVVSTDVDFPVSVYAKDLDGDGDIDIISGSQDDKKVAWYANSGKETFGEQQILNSDADYINCVFADDLDGDGRNDIIISTLDIDWYRNLGEGNFSAKIAIDNSRSTQSIHTADIDNDGDPDLVTAYFGSGEILWYENDGNGNFGAGDVIYSEASRGRYAYPADLDNDGDFDIIAATTEPHQIIWFENTGNGIFGSLNTISNEVLDPISVFASDLDGDGDLDVLSGSYGDNTVAWYENKGISISLNSQALGIPSYDNKINVFPNPANSSCRITLLSESDDEATITIYNTQGIQMGTFYTVVLAKGSNEFDLDVSGFAQGLYIVKVTGKKENIGVETLMVR